MKLFRFLAYLFAFFIGAVFAFRGTNSFPAPPPKQYKPTYVVNKPTVIDNVSSSVAPLSEQEQLGKTLFLTNCGMCHSRNMKDRMTGPALGGVEARWSEFPREDLYRWVRNSQSLISEEHPRALSIWKEWNETIMTSFPNLSDEDIEGILAYIEAVY